MLSVLSLTLSLFSGGEFKQSNYHLSEQDGVELIYPLSTTRFTATAYILAAVSEKKKNMDDNNDSKKLVL